jgi:hypothetical protein
VVADVDHLHVKRIHLMGFSYIVIENMMGTQSDFCLVFIDYGNLSDCKTKTL